MDTSVYTNAPDYDGEGHGDDHHPADHSFEPDPVPFVAPTPNTPQYHCDDDGRTQTALVTPSPQPNRGDGWRNDPDAVTVEGGGGNEKDEGGEAGGDHDGEEEEANKKKRINKLRYQRLRAMSWLTSFFTSLVFLAAVSVPMIYFGSEVHRMTFVIPASILSIFAYMTIIYIFVVKDMHVGTQMLRKHKQKNNAIVRTIDEDVMRQLDNERRAALGLPPNSEHNPRLTNIDAPAALLQLAEEEGGADGGAVVDYGAFRSGDGEGADANDKGVDDGVSAIEMTEHTNNKDGDNEAYNAAFGGEAGDQAPPSTAAGLATASPTAVQPDAVKKRRRRKKHSEHGAMGVVGTFLSAVPPAGKGTAAENEVDEKYDIRLVTPIRVGGGGGAGDGEDVPEPLSDGEWGDGADKAANNREKDDDTTRLFGASQTGAAPPVRDEVQSPSMASRAFASLTSVFRRTPKKTMSATPNDPYANDGAAPFPDEHVTGGREGNRRRAKAASAIASGAPIPASPRMPLSAMGGDRREGGQANRSSSITTRRLMGSASAGYEQQQGRRGSSAYDPPSVVSFRRDGKGVLGEQEARYVSDDDDHPHRRRGGGWGSSSEDEVDTEEEIITLRERAQEKRRAAKKPSMPLAVRDDFNTESALNSLTTPARGTSDNPAANSQIVNTTAQQRSLVNQFTPASAARPLNPSVVAIPMEDTAAAAPQPAAMPSAERSTSNGMEAAKQGHDNANSVADDGVDAPPPPLPHASGSTVPSLPPLHPRTANANAGGGGMTTPRIVSTVNTATPTTVARPAVSAAASPLAAPPVLAEPLALATARSDDATLSASHSSPPPLVVKPVGSSSAAAPAPASHPAVTFELDAIDAISHGDNKSSHMDPNDNDRPLPLSSRRREGSSRAANVRNSAVDAVNNNNNSSSSAPYQQPAPNVLLNNGNSSRGHQRQRSNEDGGTEGGGYQPGVPLRRQRSILKAASVVGAVTNDVANESIITAGVFGASYKEASGSSNPQPAAASFNPRASSVVVPPLNQNADANDERNTDVITLMNTHQNTNCNNAATRMSYSHDDEHDDFLTKEFMLSREMTELMFGLRMVWCENRTMKRYLMAVELQLATLAAHHEVKAAKDAELAAVEAKRKEEEALVSPRSPRDFAGQRPRQATLIGTNVAMASHPSSAAVRRVRSFQQVREHDE